MKNLYFSLVLLAYSLFINAQTPTGTSTEVGITEGQLSVSLSGGASYSLPIAVPPGINSVVPQVSLTYNSQGGNGLAGYGWNITGVSTISRIPASKFHDGAIDAVDFNSLDRFAFDGQRLVIKNGTSGVYGAEGTAYETENFSNIKITSFGVHPSGTNFGPSHFIVEYPDGSKAYYGSTTNSRSITNWAIEYWENLQGVRISYTYTLANNNLSIASIKYGSTFTNTPINEIQFVYKSRQRPEQAYISGQSILNNNILSSIAVLGNGIGFRNYVLEQDVTSLGYERLIKITESCGNNTRAYNPTIFTYDTTNEVLNYDPIVTNLNSNNVSSINSITVPGDFNGDGKMDFLLYPTTGTTSKSKYWLFYNLDPLASPNVSFEQNIGAFEEIFASSLLTGDATSGYKLMPKQGWTIIKNNDPTNTTTFSNYSAEGAISPVTLQHEKSYQFPTFSWGYASICGNYSSYMSRTYTIPKKFINGDFNGDGLTDVIAIEKPITYQSTCDRTSFRIGGQSYLINLDKRITTNFATNIGIITPSTADKYMVADFNGDGKSDLFVFNYQSVRVYTLNGLNQFALLYENTTVDPDILFERPILMGDYNGDGKSDFIIPKGYGKNYAKYISTGVSFVKTAVTYDIPYVATSGVECLDSNMIIPTDINGDGKTDLITYSTAGCITNNTGRFWIRVWANMDSNFVNTATYNTGTINGLKPYAIPIFLTSDKPNFNLELAAISDNKIYRFNSQKDFSKERLLKAVTTGNGIKESITYGAVVNDPCTYNCNPLYRSSSTIENYPNFDIPVAPSFQVVSKLEKIKNNSVYKKQTFGYYGAVSNLEGLGFIGFRSTMRTNWYDDNTTIVSTISKFDIGLRGANTENYSTLYLFSPSSSFAPTDFISKSILGYNSATEALQTNKVFKLKNISSQNFNGLELTSSNTSTLYDDYNNPTLSTTTISNGGTVEQTTISNVGYAPVTANPYIVGRPTSKSQSVTISGDSTSSNELYEYNNHLLTQVKKYGNGTTDFITEDNNYDAFGNITKKTITVPAVAPSPVPAPRVTNYEYDPSGRFLIKSFDIEGLATTFEYNNYNGTITSETNPYGLTTSYIYDPWFKKTKTTDYLGNSNTYTYSRSNSIYTLVTTTGDDGSSSEETFDDLGRKIKSGVKNINGTFSYIDYLYDIYDRNFKVSEPYFGNNPSQWNETQYDVYGRIIKTISFTGKSVTMNYNGLLTTVIDAAKTKVTTKNAIGNVVLMTDTPGGSINYSYFANGNLKTSNYDGVMNTISQDAWGRKKQLIDPSAGTYSYTYNLFGETTSETTPNGTTTYTLDGVGKLIKKTIVGTNTNSETTYTYDDVTKLPTATSFKDLLNGNAITSYRYEYDAYKRLYKTTEITPYASFIKQLTFDTFGRIETETPTATVIASGKSSAKTIQYTYTNGYQWQLQNQARGGILWQTNTVNARGQLTNAVQGKVTIANTYDDYGYATQIKHDWNFLGTSRNVMTLNTVFDPQNGNLTSRTNSMFNTTDTFVYDSLDRLTSYPNAQGTTETQSYDNRGRITQNALGIYNYANNAKVYQNTSVTLATPAVLAYYTAKPTQKISYNTFKSPTEIEEVGTDKISFTYTENNSRSAMFYGSLAADKNVRPNRKYYAADGSMEIKITPSGTEFITYIGGDAYTAPIILKSNGITQNFLYLHRDYQGSILAVTNDSGQILEKRLFDAWGSLINYYNASGVPFGGWGAFDRGYTGHEHLTSVGLINMNARLYDPKLHRFLQPDNYVQEPFNTQNFNRYGYCWNNPFKYNDTSGEWIWIVAAAVIGGVVNWGVHGFRMDMEGLKAFGIGAAAGTIGALTGGAAFGAAGGAAGGVGGVLAGAAGGAVGAAFSQTFLSVGNSYAFGDPLMSGKDMIKGIAFGAVLGGVFNGIAALRNGRTFWNGTLPNPKVVTISLPEPTGLVKAGTPEIKTDVKLPSTTQTSTAPTTQNSTATAINKELGVVDVSKNPAFRYMGKEELNAVKETGFLRGGNAGETFFTKDVYNSASLSQQRLALPTTPTLRVEFEILNNPSLQLNGSKVLPAFSMPGKGSEFMTLDPVKVRLINWQYLR